MDALGDRLVAWTLRAAATALILAGIALFVAGVPTWSMVSGSAHDILVVVLEIGAAFVLCGIAAMIGARLPRLPAGVPPASTAGGWTIGLALTLIVVPAWLLVTLQPFLSEWRVVATLGWSSGFWKNANANMSGVILIPMAAALAPPAFELAALAGCVLSSIVMLALLLSRSARFPRLYVAAVLLLTALVAASLRGTAAAAMTTDALQPFIQKSKPRPEEYAQIRGVVDRYQTAVAPTAAALAWAWLGYAIWVPPVVLSGRRR